MIVQADYNYNFNQCCFFVFLFFAEAFVAERCECCSLTLSLFSVARLDSVENRLKLVGWVVAVKWYVLVYIFAVLIIDATLYDE